MVGRCLARLAITHTRWEDVERIKSLSNMNEDLSITRETRVTAAEFDTRKLLNFHLYKTHDFDVIAMRSNDVIAKRLSL